MNATKEVQRRTHNSMPAPDRDSRHDRIPGASLHAVRAVPEAGARKPRVGRGERPTAAAKLVARGTDPFRPSSEPALPGRVSGKA